MRDVGILIWVALLLIGVIGSMVSSVRRRLQMQDPRVAAAARMRPPQTPGVVTAGSTTAPRVVVAPATPAHEPERRERSRFRFSGHNELVRAVIAAEVLGKPLALRDEDSSY